MSKVLIEKASLIDIGDAIRSKNSGSTQYKPSEMGATIRAISSGITPTGTVNITQNGTANVTQYASAAVNVPNSYSASDEGKVVYNGALVSQTSRTITNDGTYDTTTNNVIIVESGESSVLPSGYTQKEYVQSSGTQYIDTGIKAQGGLYAEVEFEFYEAVSGWHAIISADNSNINSAFKLLVNGMTGGTLQYGTNNYYDYSKTYNTGVKYKAYIGNGGVIDGEFFAKWNKASFESTNNVCLFVNATGSSHSLYLKAKIYSCKIWNNGTLVRNYIPCVRNNDNKVGFYDLVSESFFSNAGTGSFTSN